jgi:hypothetical protein
MVPVNKLSFYTYFSTHVLTTEGRAKAWRLLTHAEASLSLTLTGARAKAWCFIYIHAETSVSLSLTGRGYTGTRIANSIAVARTLSIARAHVLHLVAAASHPS